jgi:cell division protein FtsQ
VKRRLLVLPLLVGLAAVAYFLFLRGSSVTPHLAPSRATAMIGSGSSAVAVGANGAILTWLPAPEEGSLPKLPLEAPPKDGRLHGPVLEQAEVLGAAPPALRPYVERSYFGESGVDVKLTSGIELRFGDSDQAARKWRSAAAVLADPAVTTLGYVDLHAPAHPGIGGSGHTLPPLP